MHTTECIPSLTGHKNWLKCTKVKLDFENQPRTGFGQRDIGMHHLFGRDLKDGGASDNIESQNSNPGSSLEQFSWSARYSGASTGDGDSIQNGNGLKSKGNFGGKRYILGDYSMFIALYNGFKISLRKLDKGLFQREAWNYRCSLGARSNTTLRILSVRGVPPPLTDKNFAKKKLRIWGVPPSPPLRTFPQKNIFKKC